MCGLYPKADLYLIILAINGGLIFLGYWIEEKLENGSDKNK